MPSVCASWRWQPSKIAGMPLVGNTPTVRAVLGDRYRHHAVCALHNSPTLPQKWLFSAGGIVDEIRRLHQQRPLAARLAALSVIAILQELHFSTVCPRPSPQNLVTFGRRAGAVYRYAKNSTVPVSRLYIEPAILMPPLDSSSRSTGLLWRTLAIVIKTFSRATASTNA